VEYDKYHSLTEWSISDSDISPVGGGDPSGTNPGQRSAGGYQRPDCLSGVDPNSRSTPGNYFNASAFAVPANNIGRFGNCPVGFLHGPGTTVFSATIGKAFAVSDRVNLRYEAAFANLFNIENLGVPDTRITDSNFGVYIRSSESGASWSTHNPDVTPAKLLSL